MDKENRGPAKKGKRKMGGDPGEESLLRPPAKFNKEEANGGHPPSSPVGESRVCKFKQLD